MEIGRIGFLRGRAVKSPAIGEFNGNAVSAAVPVIDAVERLMDVADKVNDETQGIGAFRRGLGLILQDLHLVVDSFGYATFGIAELRKIVWRGDAEWNIEKMPRTGFAMLLAKI